MIDPTPYVPSALLAWQRAAPEQTVWVEDGALAFLDVSGFTAMSERLGRLGREGAEVVTDVIGSTFDELLGVAYEAGGSLLKFGGDALLLWFSGASSGVEDAAKRACFAAARTRSRLRSMGAIPTPMGGLRLRMSAGVHAGEFRFFVVGSHGRELVVTGPGVSRTVEMESAASAGEVLASPETAALLGPRWFSYQQGPGVLLKMPPPVGSRVVPSLPSAAGVDVPMLLSTAVRRHLAGGVDEPEHRHAAVGFVKFRGTDGLSVDGVAGRLHDVVTAVQTACDEHGVALLNTDIERDGGKFLLSAGAPETAGDEDERMLRALRAVVGADLPLRVQAGAHRGLVFAGSVGPHYRRSYTLMGDVVNTAARVMAHAQPGQVLATQDVLDHTRTRFGVRSLPPFAAKGKAKAVTAFEVGEPEASAREAVGSGLFVDRVDEMALLETRLDQACQAAGGFVEISGEAGIGKSRLLRELRGLAAVRGMGEVVVRADIYDAASPYASFRPLLRGMLGDDVRAGLARLAPELVADAPLLESVVSSASSPSPEPGREVAGFDRQVWRARLHGVVAAVLAASFHRPLLLIVEDAHWLDEPSAELVRFLARSARGRRWLVVSARRADEGVSLAGAGQALRLEGLDGEAAGALVAARAGRVMLRRHVGDIVARADGNPLFLEQLTAAFDPDADVVPERLEALVAARIDKLPGPQRNALRQLSVLGPAFEIESAAVVLERPPLAASDLDGLAEFVEVDGRGGRFRQHVFQSVAYAGLSFRRRRELHERYALHAEDAVSADDALLATHFDLADRFDRAWRYGFRAAEQARSQHAYPEAVALYRMALRGAGRVDPDGAELRRAWQGLGDSLRFMGRQADAVVPYRKARALADEWLDVSELCLVEGDLRQRLGKLPAAMRWFQRGLRLFDGQGCEARSSGSPPSTAMGKRAQWVHTRLLLSAGKLRNDQGRYAEAVRLLREGVCEAESAGDRVAVGHGSLWLSYALLPMGGSEGQAEGAGERAEALAERALAIYQEIGAVPWEAAALNSLALAQKRHGRWSAAVRLWERARQRIAELGDPIATAIVGFNRGELLLEQGRVQEAVVEIQDSLDAFEAAGHAYAAVAEGSLARASAAAGDLERAEPLFASAVSRLETAGLHAYAREALVRWAEARAYAGLAEEAASLIDGLSPGPDPVVEACLARVRALVAWQRGAVDVARVELASSLELARGAGNDEGAALAVLTAHRLGVGLGAAQEFDLDLDLTEAELVLARLGVVTTPQLLVRASASSIDSANDSSRRELCTRQSS